MIGQTVQHYEILDKLGEGGMGVVFKARDTKLDRTVALKFLPPHLTKSKKDRKRFIREAKSAAALNNPNICTIYSVDEYNDRQFIVMEYIDGQTLKTQLETRNLEPETSLTYAVQIAEALGEAHEKGIIHRDIKPGNIMIDANNRVKVMDFGLAKMTDSAPITQTGATVGTMAYMAPEQIEGKQIDHRADLFSFGVVLYEMLAGERPFKGQYDAALTYAIANEDPPLLSELKPELPEELSRLVSQLLEKDPEDRYASAEELAKNLKTCLNVISDPSHGSPIEPTQTNQSASSSTEETVSKGSKDSDSTSITINFPPLRSRNTLVGLSTGLIILLLVGYWLLPLSNSEPPPDNSIAVLPLENMSADPADTNLVDGVHVELINRLAGIGDLTVIARSSVLDYPAGNRDLQQIADELGVSSLMEGTVQRADDQLRVSVQLVNAGNQSTIWSGSFEENVDDIFQMQSRIAQQVAGELQATLTEDEQQRLEERPTDNPEAYRIYLQGREYLSRSAFNQEASLAAIELFNRAIEADPEFAQSWAMLAVAHSNIYWFYEQNQERLVMLEEAAKEAQRLNPDLPESKLAAGLYQYWSNSDHSKTLSYFNEALDRFPNNPMLHRFTALTHRRLGNWNEMEYHLKKAVELNPNNPTYYNKLAYNNWYVRDYEEAKFYNDSSLEMTPDTHALVRGLNSWLLLEIENSFEGFETWKQRGNPLENSPFRWGEFFLLKRDFDRVLEIYTNMKNSIIWDVNPAYIHQDYLIANVLFEKGDTRKALDYFEEFKNHLDSLIVQHPEQASYRATLGKVYARLDEHEKAIEEGNKAVELLPVSQDAYAGTFIERDLAKIYAWTGRVEQAIDKLEYLLSIPSVVHRNWIRHHPNWDSLRDNPRFQELIEEVDEPYIEGL
ncbi:MAG: protein kinase [Bacteroidetes bacterium]|jgi:serine/threonine protein kinase/Flp pilus assembly protein TadD|nr:protein kinase [Bacteroidota bacterium]